jgi:hypothetical protein
MRNDMTTPQSQQEFREWLDAEIAEALEAAKESSKAAMNSYGAGMDYGVYEGLLTVRRYFTGE